VSSDIVVAIDGPSGSGKSSVAKGIAERFSLAYLDTGAMYRGMTWFMLNADVNLEDPPNVAARCKEPKIVSGLDPRDPSIHVDGVDVGEAIRTPEVTTGVSLVSAVPEVREQLVALQRGEVSNSLAGGHGIVVEGRDIGSAVLPDAGVKVFLTADPKIRAARRAAEDAGRSHGSAGVEATKASLERRDRLDTQRTISPLRTAEGAHTVDATYLNLEETIDAVAVLVTAALEKDPS
jgi:cytidylate kinase